VGEPIPIRLPFFWSRQEENCVARTSSWGIWDRTCRRFKLQKNEKVEGKSARTGCSAASGICGEARAGGESSRNTRLDPGELVWQRSRIFAGTRIGVRAGITPGDGPDILAIGSICRSARTAGAVVAPETGAVSRPDNAGAVVPSTSDRSEARNKGGRDGFAV